jgi:Uncharacterized conserved domain (SAYSvFN)
MPDLNSRGTRALRAARRALPYVAFALAYGAMLSAAADTDPAAVQLLLAVTAAAVVAGSFYLRPSGADGGGTGRRLSAYSVFNPGIESMLGSLRAEQFDQEVRHRPTYVTLRILLLSSHRSYDRLLCVVQNAIC